MYNSFKNLKKKEMSSDIVPWVLGPFLLLWYPSRPTYSLLYFKWLHDHIFSFFLSHSLKYWIRHTQFTAIQLCSSIVQLCAFAFQDLVSPSIRNDLLLISDSPVFCPWGSSHIVPSVLCQPVSPLSSQFLHNNGHAL